MPADHLAIVRKAFDDTMTDPAFLADMAKAQQIKAKFDVCAAEAVDKTTAEKIYATLNTLGEQPSLKDFWPLLRKA